MNLSKLKQVVRSEIEKQLPEIVATRITDMEIPEGEFLVLKLHGDFTKGQYDAINNALSARFGNRALAIGTTKDYTIEIVKGKIKGE